MQLLYLMCHVYQFYLVLRKCRNAHVPFLGWFETSILGTFLSTLAPQAGDLYRPVSLKATCGLAYTRYLAVYFLFAWLDTCLGLGLSLGVDRGRTQIAEIDVSGGRVCSWPASL